MVSMAQRITELRSQKGLSSQQLSQMMGLSRQAVEKYESGRQTPSKEHQQKMAAFFEVSVAYLRGETNDPTTQESWMDMVHQASAEPEPTPAPAIAPKASGKKEKEELGGALLDSLLVSPKVREELTAIVRQELRSEQGKELIRRIVREELKKR